jgi:hypothetical protein
MVFTLIHRWIDLKDKRFFDAYSRRLAVYEDVINELITMMSKQNPNTIHRLSGIDMSGIIIENIHTLNTLISRLLLYGSPDSVEPIRMLKKQIVRLQDIALDIPGVLDQKFGNEIISTVFTGYIDFIESALGSFRDLVSVETGKNLVDKKITKIAKKIIDRAKRVKRQNNKVDNNLKGDKPSQS